MDQLSDLDPAGFAKAMGAVGDKDLGPPHDGHRNQHLERVSPQVAIVRSTRPRAGPSAVGFDHFIQQAFQADTPLTLDYDLVPRARGFAQPSRTPPDRSRSRPLCCPGKVPAGGESHDPNPLVADARDALNSMRRSIHGTFDSRRISGPRDRFRIIGDLTIHGVTREVTLQATFNGTGTTPFGQPMAGFSAETTINRKDFGLNWNAARETGGVLVGDEPKVAIEIEAVLQDPTRENQAS